MISLIYRNQKLVERSVSSDTLAAAKADPSAMIWLDLCAPSTEEVKQVLQDIFHFHPLAIEDCVSDSAFPKQEAYDDYLYVVLHTARPDEKLGFRTSELDLFLGKNYLVSYHRDPMPCIEEAMKRFADDPTRLVRGPDRFAETILDSMVASYAPLMKSLQTKVERIEEGVLADIGADEVFQTIMQLRKQLSRLRQILRPQVEMANELARGSSPFLRREVLPYLRDHAEELSHVELQAGAWAEQLILSFRIFLNKSSHEANEGIRVLTGITALTFPALLVGSWFGMNFTGMKELSHSSAYPIAAALTLIGTAGTWLIMRAKKWI